MTRYRNSAEGGTNGVTATTANTGGASLTAATDLPGSVAPTFSNAHAAGSGSLSYAFQAASGSTCIWQWTGLNAPTGSTLGVRFSIYLTALPSQTTEVVQLRTATGVTARAFITNQGKIQLNDAGNALTALFSNPLALNTWYDIVVKARPGTGTADGGLYVSYALNSAPATPVETPFSTTTGNAGTAPLNMVRYGKLTATSWATVFYLDTLTADDSASFASAPVVTAGPDITTTTGAPVILQGSGVNADIALPTFAWTKDSGPTGYTLDSTTTPTPTFTASTAGTYVLRLTATDDQAATAADTVTVTVTGTSSPPSVSATSSQNPVVNAVGTAGAGGNLTYSITPSAGVTVLAPGIWQVPDPTADTVYTVTVTESGSGLTSTTTTTVHPSTAATVGTKRKSAGAWV